MRTPPSIVWIILMVIGGAIVVVSNVYYQLAKEREAKERLAQDARAILMPEIRENAALVANMQQILRRVTFPQAARCRAPRGKRCRTAAFS